MRARFSPVSLDALDFLLADVRGALGPYLNIFLVTQQNWSQASVRLVATGGGLLGLAVQVPIGGRIAMPETARASDTPPARSRRSPPGFGREPAPACSAALVSGALGRNS